MITTETKREIISKVINQIDANREARQQKNTEIVNKVAEDCGVNMKQFDESLHMLGVLRQETGLSYGHLFEALGYILDYGEETADELWDELDDGNDYAAVKVLTDHL
jgi:hypothetical protein